MKKIEARKDRKRKDAWMVKTNGLPERGIKPPPEIDDATRREFLIGAAGLLLLPVACGSDGGSGGDTSGETRSFTHAGGTTEIPARPQRIVTLHDQNALLPLLELGVKPVGSVGNRMEGGREVFVRTEDFDTEDVAFVGQIGEPNLEAIAAESPDLIVGTESEMERQAEDLQRIAPTVFIGTRNRPLPEALRDYAGLADAEDRWEELDRDYRAAVSALQEDLPRPADEIVVSLVQFMEDGQFFVDTPYQTYTVLSDVGFARPAPQQDMTERIYFSFERLPEHDGDVILTGDFSEEGFEETALASARQSPLFQTLGAVERGEFHVYDGLEMVGAAYSKMQTFLQFLRLILVDRPVNFRDGG
jgi:iron complex transport system substrate-binding protein